MSTELEKILLNNGTHSFNELLVDTGVLSREWDFMCTELNNPSKGLYFQQNLFNYTVNYNLQPIQAMQNIFEYKCLFDKDKNYCEVKN